LMGVEVPLRRRVPRAILVGILNLVFWVLIPGLLGSLLAQTGESTPLTSMTFVYAFGLAITGVQVLGALTQGMALSVPFTTGGYLAQAYYIWLATDGGNLKFAASGVSIGLGFAPIVYLLMLPSLFSALRSPLAFFLDQSEVNRPFPDQV
jgi:hypothetical protein